MGTKTKDQASISKPRAARWDDAQGEMLAPIYARTAFETPVPKFELPDQEMHPRWAYQLIHDELMLDGNARLNLATFVTTWMEPEALRGS